MFESCYENIGVHLDRKQSFTIEATLQSMFESNKRYLGALNTLNRSEGLCFEMGCILLSMDKEGMTDDVPEFEGACFEYDDDYVFLSLVQAETILQRSMDVVDLKSNYPEEYEKFCKEGILIKN